MTDQEFVAGRDIKAVNPDGSSFTIHMRLGRPYQVDEDQWACPVALDGLYKRLVDQHGVDSWQALQLAYRLAVELLADFVEKGGKLFLWEEEKEVSLNSLLLRVGPRQVIVLKTKAVQNVLILMLRTMFLGSKMWGGGCSLVI